MGCQVGRDAQGTCGVITILQVNSAKMNGEIRLGLGRNNGFSQVILTSRDLRSADTRQLCGYMCSIVGQSLHSTFCRNVPRHDRSTLVHSCACKPVHPFAWCQHTHTSTQCCLHFRHAYSTCCLDRLDPSAMQTYTSYKHMQTVAYLKDFEVW